MEEKLEGLQGKIWESVGEVKKKCRDLVGFWFECNIHKYICM